MPAVRTRPSSVLGGGNWGWTGQLYAPPPIILFRMLWCLQSISQSFTVVNKYQISLSNRPILDTEASGLGRKDARFE